MVLEFCSPSCTMPFETMGQRGLSTPPCFLEEVSVSYEKELGFWKPKVMHYDQGALSVDSLELPLSYVAKEKEKHHIGGEEKTPKFSRGSPTLYMQPVSDSAETNEINLNGTRYWSCLPSSMLSEVFGKQLGLSTNDVLFHKTADTVASYHEEEEPFGSMEDIEAQTIGNLLPDEDDIFSGMIDGLEYVADAKEGDAEDFDLFSSVGGMELGVDDVSYVNQKDADFSGGVLKGWWSPNGSPATRPHREHPSITLFVGNVNSNVEDSELRVLFERYGDIRNLYTACKHQGFVMISYFDIGAARNAMIALQNKLLRGQKLVIHYSIPKDYPLKKCSELGQDKTGLLISSGEKSSSESMSTFSHEGRTLGCFNNGSVQGFHSASHEPLGALTENAFSDGTTCVLNSLPSSLRAETAGSHFGLHKPGHSLDQVKFGSQRIPIFHPHSSPDCQDNCKICIPHNTLSTFANMASKIGSTVSDRMNGTHTSMVYSNGQAIEHKEEISDPTGNVTCPVHGHHWSSSNLFELQPSSPIVWQISPLFSSGVNAPCPPHLPGFSGMPPDMLNTVSLPHNPHVGSALPINPSLWDRQHAYKRESPEDSAFCLGSFGSVGFPGGSPLHLLGGASHIFSHSGENCMEKRNDALPSPHHLSHICPDRKTVTSLPNSFGSPREYGRNLSHRRNQGSSNHADKKQFELDINHILHGEDSRTTLMIKNIPNKYTSKMLLAAIDDHCQGTYDFIYLPIDFKNKCNVGYAFINLIDPVQIIPFYKVFSGKKWEKFNSEKVAALAYARIQGKAALVAHFQNSSLMNEDKRCRPILFCTDGPNAGEQEPFPMVASIQFKPSKARSSFDENNNQGSPSTSANGEGSPNEVDSSGSVRESD